MIDACRPAAARRDRAGRVCSSRWRDAWDWRPAVLLVDRGAGGALSPRLGAPPPDAADPAPRRAGGSRAYLIGLGSVVLALCSPLELLAELSFTAHMVQHQLLIMGAPPAAPPGGAVSR